MQGSSRGATRQLPIDTDVRRHMLDFYRERDREDADRFASGEQRGRVGVYATAVARLEGDSDVYESYQLLRAAGIELPKAAETIVASLMRDWRHVCRIDGEGRVWTASLQEKKASMW